jgi:hypothetical protein
LETYKKITLLVRDEGDNLEKILNDIKKSGNIGHTFDIVIDPDEKGGRKYGWDGDGADHIHDIKVETMKSNKPPKFTNEGLYKPGGKYIGIISKQPKRMVKCPKCKGTGDMSDTKSGITCDKCLGQGKLYVDPGERQRDDLFEADKIDTQWNNLPDSTNDHCESCFGEEYESGTGELKKYLGKNLCKQCFFDVMQNKKKFSDIEEMSTVAGVAGFNAPMSTNKKGIKHNFPIKEFTLDDFRTKWDDLRWSATSTQLKQYADRIGVQYSDILEGPSFKRKLAARIAEKLKIPMKETEQNQNYRVSVSFYDRMHTMVSKRNELILKTITVVASSPESAKEIAIKHFRKLHFSVKDAEVIKVTENMKTFKQLVKESVSTVDKQKLTQWWKKLTDDDRKVILTKYFHKSQSLANQSFKNWPPDAYQRLVRYYETYII